VRRWQDPDEGLTQEEKEEAQRVKMQKHVINEILATERAYVKDLAFVAEVPLSPPHLIPSHPRLMMPLPLYRCC
jgi:hypothetical protein